MESGNFEVCASDPNVIKGRQVIIYRSGRIRLSKDTNQDGYHESTSGSNHMFVYMIFYPSLRSAQA